MCQNIGPFSFLYCFVYIFLQKKSCLKKHQFQKNTLFLNELLVVNNVN